MQNVSVCSYPVKYEIFSSSVRNMLVDTVFSPPLVPFPFCSFFLGGGGGGVWGGVDRAQTAKQIKTKRKSQEDFVDRLLLQIRVHGQKKKSFSAGRPLKKFFCKMYEEEEKDRNIGRLGKSGGEEVE